MILISEEKLQESVVFCVMYEHEALQFIHVDDEQN
jgi:hypothetical protein